MTMSSVNTMNLILGSTSPYRRQLLECLMISFSCEKPLCDEDQFKAIEKDPIQLARLLARKKAESLSGANRTVIGADQLVSFNEKILGKPGNFDKALQQLSTMQGKTHELITAVCVISPNKTDEFIDITKVHLKALSTDQIRSYLLKDEPWDCAGSYKIEKHGMALIEQIETKDFTAIQGLPLIHLSKVLHNLGYEIPNAKIKDQSSP